MANYSQTIDKFQYKLVTRPGDLVVPDSNFNFTVPISIDSHFQSFLIISSNFNPFPEMSSDFKPLPAIFRKS